MTTIACRNGIVAADSVSTVGDYRQPLVARKLVRVGSKIAAVLGEFVAFDLFLDWLDHGGGGGGFPVPPETKFVVFERREGRDFVREFLPNGQTERFVDPFIAYGTGMGLAYGAMHAGASAEGAVAAGIAFDIYSGGRVVSLALEG